MYSWKFWLIHEDSLKRARFPRRSNFQIDVADLRSLRPAAKVLGVGGGSCA